MLCLPYAGFLTSESSFPEEQSHQSFSILNTFIKHLILEKIAQSRKKLNFAQLLYRPVKFRMFLHVSYVGLCLFVLDIGFHLPYIFYEAKTWGLFERKLELLYCISLLSQPPPKQGGRLMVILASFCDKNTTENVQYSAHRECYISNNHIFISWGILCLKLLFKRFGGCNNKLNFTERNIFLFN